MEFDPLGTNNMEHRAKACGDAMKPEAHIQFFSSALKFAFLGQALTFVKAKSESVPEKILAWRV